MKEAAGEANMTVITIVLIAVVLGVGIILVPKLMGNTSKSACCTNSGNVWYNNACHPKSVCTISNGATSCSSTTVQPSC